MKGARFALAVLLLLAPTVAAADADDALAAAVVDARRGGMLPLEVPVMTQGGSASHLARFFGRVPVVIVFGQYRCPNLCSTMMEGVLLALVATGLPPDAYRVLGVSIDPGENAADARQRAASYEATFPQMPLDLLTGTATAMAKLAGSAGVRYAYDAAAREYAHPLAMVIATPEGRISEYLPGVRFDAKTLRLALVDASDGRLGSTAERVFLRCAHYDPQTGRYSVSVMSAVRAIMLLLVAGGVWIVRHARHR